MHDDWATTTGVPAVGTRIRGRDSQLSGVLIVEPRDYTPIEERVFVISQWNETVTVDGKAAPVRRIVMNGKSWPEAYSVR